MGKSTISMAIFNSYVSHYQRVNLYLYMICWGLDVKLPLFFMEPSTLISTQSEFSSLALGAGDGMP